MWWVERRYPDGKPLLLEDDTTYPPVLVRVLTSPVMARRRLKTLCTFPSTTATRCPYAMEATAAAV